MNLKILLLLIGSVLLGIGILKPNINLLNNPNPSPAVIVDGSDLSEPTDEKLKSRAKDVIKALSSNNDRKTDGKRLASLYSDLANLVSLDGEDQVIKNTEEIRQANKLVGLMLRLDIKGKYEDLPEAAQALMLEAIGDDQVLLSTQLRAKAVDGFKALAWSCYEGSK
jgi:hypothetical protein